MPLTTIPQTATSPARDEVRVLANVLAKLIANGAANSGALAIGTTKSKVTLGADVNYRINGQFYLKEDAADVWTPAGSAVGPSLVQKYLLCLDSAGTATVIQGVPAATADAVVLPAPPEDRAIVGVLQVETDASTTYTPGTTLLDAAGITDTYINGFDASLLYQVTI